MNTYKLILNLHDLHASRELQRSQHKELKSNEHIHELVFMTYVKKQNY